MEAVPISSDHQVLFLPWKIFQDYDLSIGSTVQADISDISVLGQCLLLDPFDANFIQFSSISASKKSLKNLILKKIEKVNPKEALEVKVKVICSDVKVTLNFHDKYLKDLLQGLLFKNGFVINLGLNGLAKALGIEYIQLECSDHDQEVLVIGNQTQLKIECQTIHRVKAKKGDIKIGGFERQIKSLQSIKDNCDQVLHKKLNSFLVSGPPGSGKTSLVKYVFDEFLILNVQCSELMRSHPGETEKLLKELFKKADLNAQEGPTLLLLEDIDLIGNSKDGEDSKSSHNIRLICHLRSNLDEFNSSTLVIGATTCHPMNVHESLKRPGRLTHEIFIQVPSLPERLEMIKALDPELQCEQCLEIAQVTQGYLASDLNQLVVHLSQGSDFQSALKSALRLTSPSGFKSGIGTVQVNPLSWSQIGGLQDVKEKLQAAIMWPIKYPDMFKTLDLKRPKGVLVHGPPGCGKTTLVRAMASMSGATFFSISAAAIYSPYVGDSEKSLAQVFHKARLAAPSVLFIDEIDGMVTNRDDNDGSSSNGVQERILSVLLNEMDGIGSTDQAERIGVRLTKTFITFSAHAFQSARLREGFEGTTLLLSIEHFFENVQ